MGDIGGRFTEGAKRLVAEATSCARELGHSYIGSEHFLLGLLRIGDCTAANLLYERGCEYAEMRSRVIGLVGMGARSSVTADDMTPSVRRILLRASLSVKSAGGNRVGNEHILLSLLREECTGARLISERGVDISELAELLSGICRAYAAALPRKRPATPLLDANSTDLTEKARRGEIDPVINRDEEKNRMAAVLLRRMKNNPCLVGEAGVGKTAVAEALASDIVSGAAPKELRDMRLLSLELSGVVAGTKYRGEFEEKIKGIIEEAKSAGNIILFIDEIHTIVGAGGAEGAIDASNILKPALARGEIRLIGATTPREFAKSIGRDKALERRMQRIDIQEPTPESCVQMLFGLREKYERFHGICIADGALRAAVELSERYIGDRFLPDKAIDLIDEAAASKKLSGDRGELSAADIAAAAERSSGIPIGSIERGKRLSGLEAELKERIVGQDAAINRLCPAVKSAHAGIRSSGRPAGSFLFIGSSGVGKTECARALSDALFRSESAFIRLDMSEYSEPHSVSKLIGSPPGYVGYGESFCTLAQRVRREPYSLVLFDEIEKAHPDVRALLLQILDSGVLTDSEGISVPFTDTVVVMTANRGNAGGGIGFSASPERDRARTLARGLLSDAIADRIDEVIEFCDLSPRDIREITVRSLEKLCAGVKAGGARITLDKKSVPVPGRGVSYARAAVREACRSAENAIAEMLLSGGVHCGDTAVLSFENGEYRLKITEKAIDNGVAV